MMTAIRKSPTGIPGLDEITLGGLPSGRVSLVCGGAGTGKTLFALRFLLAGAVDHDEPGVFASFEQPVEELIADTSALDWGVEGMVDARSLGFEHFRVTTADLQAAGTFDLEPMFVRLGQAIEEIGARRVALDTLDVLFAALEPTRVRAELGRLFAWLKDRGVTAIVTAEAGGPGRLSRHGMEEFASDCVIVLDHRVDGGVSTRRLRILKYRGSGHGTNEYPFMLDERGFWVNPLTSLGLENQVSNQRVSTGVERLDDMLTGGYYRGSTVLVTGQPGSGKSSLAAAFTAAVGGAGGRTLFVALEESGSQIMRNMESIGIDLAAHEQADRLKILSRRASSTGLESHLEAIMGEMHQFAPDAVIVDPISSFEGTAFEVDSALARLIDFVKSRGTTMLMTMLVSDEHGRRSVGVSSVADTWLSLENVQYRGERNRGISVIKSRGMPHSNQLREFVLSDRGIEVLDAYAGEHGLQMGSARAEAEVAALAADAERDAKLALQTQRFEARRAAVAAEIEALQAQLAGEEAELATARAEAERATHAQAARGQYRTRGRSDGE